MGYVTALHTHVLQLVVNDGVLSQRAVIDILHYNYVEVIWTFQTFTIDLKQVKLNSAKAWII